MSMKVMTVNVGVNAQCTLFPNGAVHQTASPTDVWLGAGFIEWVEIHNNATGAVGGTAAMAYVQGAGGIGRNKFY